MTALAEAMNGTGSSPASASALMPVAAISKAEAYCDIAGYGSDSDVALRRLTAALGLVGIGRLLGWDLGRVASGLLSRDVHGQTGHLAERVSVLEVDRAIEFGLGHLGPVTGGVAEVQMPLTYSLAHGVELHALGAAPS